jgi:hypothetical protein
MMSDDNFSSDRDTSFTLGTRELREAKRSRTLALNTAPLKAVDEHRGSDPYNTSGSFDRKKNWARVGKR